MRLFLCLGTDGFDHAGDVTPRDVVGAEELKEISIFYNLGVGDAFQSAMLGGLINCSLLSFLSSIKNQKPTASLGIYDTISYNKKVCQFAVKAVMSISLFDVVYSLLHSVILTKKKENQIKGEEK